MDKQKQKQENNKTSETERSSNEKERQKKHKNEETYGTHKKHGMKGCQVEIKTKMFFFIFFLILQFFFCLFREKSSRGMRTRSG